MAPPRVVVAGVSGAGKSVLGAALAKRLGVAFVDGDALHAPAAVTKMARGEPLDDADRAPWLARVAAVLADAPGGAVVACSALKRGYREALREAAPGAVVLVLDAPREVLAQRLAERRGHFMPAALLDSQLAALERPTADEPGAFVLNADQTITQLLQAALGTLFPLLDRRQG